VCAASRPARTSFILEKHDFPIVLMGEACHVGTARQTAKIAVSAVRRALLLLVDDERRLSFRDHVFVDDDFLDAALPVRRT